MVQELIDLKENILAGRYTEALAIVDELEWMSKQAILRNIESFLVRLLIHLIKNQVEERLTNSWVASIVDSIRQINKLNLKDNQTSFYIKQDEWVEFLKDAFEGAIAPASTEIEQGKYNPIKLKQIINKDEVLKVAQSLLDLIYLYSSEELPDIIYQKLGLLVGGNEWLNQ